MHLNNDEKAEETVRERKREKIIGDANESEQGKKRNSRRILHDFPGYSIDPDWSSQICFKIEYPIMIADYDNWKSHFYPKYGFSS